MTRKLTFARTMEVLWQIYGTKDGMDQCAIRVKTPNHVEHTPTHFVILLDISDSMNQDHKLHHVIQCLTILLQFVKEVDLLSLITFGSKAKILLDRVSCGNKTEIQSVIQKLRTKGMTHLADGISLCESVLRKEDAKSGLLLLTDGYANEGDSTTDGLVTRMMKLKQKFPALSLANIAYGSDHNAELLKIFTEQSQGVYAIVDSMESAAFAFGDALGGFLSCVGQQTELWVPHGSVVYGNYPTTSDSEGIRVSLGDLFSGTQKVYLVDRPTGHPRASFTTTLLPSLEPWDAVPSWTEVEPDLEIRLTRLRYECTTLLKDLTKYHGMNPGEKTAFEAKVTAWKEEIAKPEYASHPTGISLVREMELFTLGMSQEAPDVTATVMQHSATLGVGRGFSSPIRSPAPRMRGRRPLRTPSPPPASAPAEDPTESTYQNETQANISRLMRTMSRRT